MDDVTKSREYNWLRVAEFILLFIGLPVLYLFELPFHRILPLIALFVYCILVLGRHGQITSAWLKIQANWKWIIIRFIVIGLLILLSIKLFSEYPLFTNLDTNRKLAYVLLIYPLLSAFPQELIFREFFFFRYRSVFKNQTTLLLVNMAAFSFAHIYFCNWIVIVFTLVGGLIFSLTYLKTKSLLVVTIEHSLYGLLVLSSGLTDFFYKAF